MEIGILVFGLIVIFGAAVISLWGAKKVVPRVMHWVKEKKKAKILEP
jgi:hypothetical protein